MSKIIIYTPAYNGKNASRAVDSILNQTHKNLYTTYLTMLQQMAHMRL